MREAIPGPCEQNDKNPPQATNKRHKRADNKENI